MPAGFLARDPIEELGRVAVGRVRQVKRVERLVIVEFGGGVDAPVAVCHFHPDDLVPQEGQLVEVLLSRDMPAGAMSGTSLGVRTMHGDLVRPHQLDAFRKLQQQLYDGTTIQVSIVGQTKDGWLGEADGFEVFGKEEPITDKERRPIRALKGDVVSAKLIEFQLEHRTFQVEWQSPTVVGLRRQQAATQLSAGDVVQGEVLWFNGGGAILELRLKKFALTAFLPDSEASWQRGIKASELLSVGEWVSLIIIQVETDDPTNIRIVVSRRLPSNRPPGLTMADLAVGMEIAGEIMRIVDYGAFIEIGPGLDGLLHITNMDPPAQLKEPATRLTVGEQLICYVFGFDRSGRISLAQRKPPDAE